MVNGDPGLTLIAQSAFNWDGWEPRNRCVAVEAQIDIRPAGSGSLLVIAFVEYGGIRDRIYDFQGFQTILKPFGRGL